MFSFINSVKLKTFLLLASFVFFLSCSDKNVQEPENLDESLVVYDEATENIVNNTEETKAVEDNTLKQDQPNIDNTNTETASLEKSKEVNEDINNLSQAEGLNTPNANQSEQTEALTEKKELVQENIKNILEEEDKLLGDQFSKDPFSSKNVDNSNVTVISTKDIQESKDQSKGSNLLDRLKITKKQITVENSLSGINLEENMYSTLLNIRNPIILVSEPSNTLNYAYSINLCSIINDSNSNLNCIVYKAESKESKFKHMRKGLNNDFSTVNLEESADLMIIRTDELLEKLKKSTKDDVPLDLVSFLNGDYFFMFTESKNKFFLIDQLVEDKNQNVINVVAFNEESKDLFIKLIAPQFPYAKFNIQSVPTEINALNNFLNNNLCAKNKNDLYIYFGSNLPDSVQNTLAKCANAITPLSFTDDSLRKIESTSDFYSLGNVMSYYDSSSVANFIDNYLDFEKEYNKKSKQQILTQVKPKPVKTIENTSNLNDNSQKNSSNKLPKIQDKQLQKALGTIENTKQKSMIEAKEKAHAKIYLYGSTTIKTFGIRYALIASRYSKQTTIATIVDSIVKDFSIINTNFLTPDMKKFTLSDVLLGTSSNNPFLYHNGVYFYPRILLSNPTKKSEDQTIAIKILSSSIDLNDIASAYGPNTPTADQLQIISSKTTDLNEKRKEISAIQIVQRELKEVEAIVEKLKSGKKLDSKDEKNSGLQTNEAISETESNTPVNQSLESLNKNKE